VKAYFEPKVFYLSGNRSIYLHGDTADINDTLPPFRKAVKGEERPGAILPLAAILRGTCGIPVSTLFNFGSYWKKQLFGKITCLLSIAKAQKSGPFQSRTVHFSRGILRLKIPWTTKRATRKLGLNCIGP